MSCSHLGLYSGTVPCATCAGSVNLKLYGCDLHQRCTLEKPVSGISCCASCPDNTDPLALRLPFRASPGATTGVRVYYSGCTACCASGATASGCCYTSQVADTLYVKLYNFGGTPGTYWDTVPVYPITYNSTLGYWRGVASGVPTAGFCLYTTFSCHGNAWNMCFACTNCGTTGYSTPPCAQGFNQAAACSGLVSGDCFLVSGNGPGSTGTCSFNWDGQSFYANVTCSGL